MLKLSAAISVCFVACAPAFGDLTEAQTLQKWNGVMVIVEALHDDAEHIDLTTAALEAGVRERLSAAGVRIFSRSERLEDERRPYLYVNCNLIFVESAGLASFSIDVEAHQRVTLVDGESAQGLTWAKSYLGIQGRDDAARKIRDVVDSYVEQFIEAMTVEDEGRDAA